VENQDGKVVPQDLIRRSERLLHIAEKIAVQAEASEDQRLCLLALDRGQRSMDTLLKIFGLTGPESVVNIDARRQTLSIYGEALQDFSEADLRVLKARLEREIESEKSLAIPLAAGEVQG
jgi:hypothetical protein